jgi:hypothetical protein
VQTKLSPRLCFGYRPVVIPVRQQVGREERNRPVIEVLAD